jgi:hypothetical protein
MEKDKWILSGPSLQHLLVRFHWLPNRHENQNWIPVEDEEFHCATRSHLVMLMEDHKRGSRSNPFADLPEELSVRILRELTAEALVNASAVCTHARLAHYLFMLDDLCA